ncbi:MAG: hypothetical protein WC652_06500, partial [archaeon]
MYPKNETDQSYEYLQKVVGFLDEPICILGGWAVYLTLNKKYNAQFQKDYLGSRDVDLGFHLDKKATSFKNSAFTKAIQKLEAEGFTERGGRLVKELDLQTGKELTPKQASKMPSYEINLMFVDLLTDHIPKGLKEETKMDILDEPLLAEVFNKKENREELIEFGRKLWLPQPWILLSTKIKALPRRTKNHKREKDIADIAGLLLLTNYKEYTQKVKKLLPQNEILKALNSITPQEITKTENLLGFQPNAFKATITNF